MTTALKVLIAILAAALVANVAWDFGYDAGRRSDSPSIWGYDCVRVDEADGNEVRCLKRHPTSYVVDCLSTNPAKCR